MADLFTYKKLPSDPCLSEEQMLSYIDGKLSPAEQHACEAHMADCEMCEDALEGLSLVKDRSVLAAPLLNSEAATPAKDEAKVVPLHPQPNHLRIMYAVAAVLVLVLGSVFILRNLSSPDSSGYEMAENKSADTLAAPDAVVNNADCLLKDKITVLDNNATRLAEGQMTFEEPAPPAMGPGVWLDDHADEIAVAPAEETEEENFSFAPPTAEPDMVVAEDVSKISPPQSQEGDKDEETTIEQTSKKENLFERIVTIPNTNSETKQKTSLSKDDSRNEKAKPANTNAPTAPEVSGGVATGAGDYSNTSTDTVSVPGNSASSLEQTYLAGVDLYNAGQANQAITMFDKVLADKNHARYEDAELMKAKALIKANRKPEAKTLLQSIEAKKGKHAAEATELLKTL